MPIHNTAGWFNTGRDITIILIDSAFGNVQLDNVTMFDSKQETDKLKSKLLNSKRLTASIPNGWSGSIGLDRGSAALDNLFAQREANWVDNGLYSTLTLYTYITESDGSTSNFQYDSVSITLDQAGEWKGDGIVTQKMSFEANSRKPV